MGCFSERSFPIEVSRLVRLRDNVAPRADLVCTRSWLEHAHNRLSGLLPRNDPAPLLTRDMIGASDRRFDVFRYFRINPDGLATFGANLNGIAQTAQVASSRLGERDRKPWAGFDDIWVPVDENVRLSGRLGLARRGDEIVSADCIVVLPGLLGENVVLRTRDICIALRDAGFHVLALELRGHGETGFHYPEVPYTYGIKEVGDLLAVSEWLEDQPYVRQTGMLGFCWGANLAMLAAWEDGRADDHPSVSPRLRPFLRPRNGRTHYSAGIIAYSPAVRFEEVLDATDREWGLFENPVLNGLQKTVRKRFERIGSSKVDGNLRRLIIEETARSEINYPGAVEEGLDYLRLAEYRGREAGDKLEAARVPILVIHAANDPLVPAQEVADFLATVENPLVAGMVLAGGGHDGFAPYARRHFYSLMINFFDANYGVAGSREQWKLARLRETESARESESVLFGQSNPP